MAKKVTVPEDGDGKGPVVSKKRHKGLSCLLAFLITVLVICGIIFGVGWYFGDKYSKEYLEMPLSDTLGVVNELYWTKDKDVVKKPFSDDDLDGFYSEIKQNILLKSDAEVDFDEALETIVSDFMKKDESAVRAPVLSSAGEDGEQSDGGIMDILVDMMASAFTRENIDVERLQAYDANNDDYIFTLRDKELAAFVNHVLEMVLGDIDVGSLVGDLPIGDIDIKSVVKLKQIYFGAQSTVNELGESEVTATTANITVWLGLEDIASHVAVSAVKDAGLGWLGGLVDFGVKTILPKNVYATVTMPLQGDAQAQVSLNAMSEGKRDNMYQIINKIMALTSSGEGEPQTVQSMLAGYAEQITPYMEKITGADGMQGAFDAAEQGDIKLDLLDMLAKMTNDEETTDPLTKADFMYLLQAVLTSDPDAKLEQLKPYLYEGWYVDDGGHYAYKPADTTGYVAVDYKDEFVEQLANKYSLDVEGKSLDEVLALLGVSLDGSEAAPDSADMIELVNGERFSQLLDEDINDIKLELTDRMLAAILNDKLGDLLKDGNTTFENIDIKLDALSFIGKADKPNHMYALLAVEVNIADYLASVGDGNQLMALATNVLPERLLLSIEVDITRSLDAGDSYSPTEFMLNDYENTGRVLDTLGKVVDGLDLASMTEPIETMLRDMMNTLYEKLDVDLVASDTTGEVVTQGAILMPDVFTLMTDLVLVDDNGERIVEPDEFKDVLSGLNEHDGFSDVAVMASDYSGFISDLKDKYYFNDILDENGNDVTDFTQLADSIGTDFSGDKLRVIPASGTAPLAGMSYLAYDMRSISELKPVMRGDEIALLVSEKLVGSSGVSDFDVLEVTTGVNKLTLILSVGVGDLMPADVNKLLNIDKIYITATVDMSRTTGEGENKAYPVSLAINNMDKTTFGNALKIIDRLGGGSFDIENQVAEFGKILYTQLASLESSLGGEGVISFTENGLELIDFYDFLINKMWNADKSGARPSAQTVKNAIQGMFARSTVEGFVNAKNYTAGDIVTNAGDAMDFGGAADEKTANNSAANTFIATFSAELTVAQEIKTDKQFNAYLDALMVRMTSEREMVRAVQTFAIDRTNTSDAADAARKWLNGRLEGSPVSADRDYLAVTFRMAMDKFMVTDSAFTSGFLPAEMYATVVIEKTTDASGKTVFRELENGVIFNNMTADEYGVLIELMSLSADADGESSSEDKINIVTITGDSVKGLNKLTELSGAKILFGTASSDGIGTVTYQM